MSPKVPILAIPTLRKPSAGHDLVIAGAGYMPIKTAWVHHRFNLHALGIVVSGRGTYRVNNGPALAIEPGSAFTVFPGPAFHYGPENGTWEEYYICATGDRVKRWVEAGWFFKDGGVHPLVNVGDVVELFRETIGLLRRDGPGDNDRADALAEQIMVEVYHGQASLRSRRGSSPSMEAVLQYCRSHLTETIDFEALARRNAMSYSKLRQRFRRITGWPPAQYLTHLRCEAARTLLAESDLAVKEIAARVGIADPYTFSRTFKRRVGLSPERYRQQTAPWAQTTDRKS